MELYEFVDNIKLLKLHKKYMYDKQYKIDNKHLFKKYSLKYYKKLVSTDEGKNHYNLTKKNERHYRELQINITNN